MPINLKKYFKRIGYTGSTNISIETLKNIHAAQVFSIPFENLIIHESHYVNNPNDYISLKEDDLFKKLVTDKRGGYCHENNELLALVLIQLGFKVDRLAARVLTAPNLPKGHKLLMVTFKDGQKWIADVGFGGYGLFEPIPLILDQETNQYGDCFKLSEENNKYVLQILDKDKWKNLYEFTQEIYQPVDYEQMSYSVSHKPTSIFVKNRICVMPRPEGRIILNNLNLKIIEHKKETNTTLQDGEEYHTALKKYFGIELPKNTRLKAIKTTEAIPNKTNMWCNYFIGAAIAAGAIGAIHFVKSRASNLK